MKKTALSLALAIFLGGAPLPSALAGGETEQLKGIVLNLLQDNDEFVRSHNPEYFKPFSEGQKPRATVVTCSDSRVHTHALDKTPDGDLFMVRNIGNQLRTAEGSVEYGVHHLHTPLLIFVGHSACGAIKAASGDYRRESRPIKRELSTIMIPRGVENMEGVIRNVNNQVAAALKKFSREVRDNKLTVAGAVYDFQDDLGKGQGRLVVINVNGNTNPDQIRPFTGVMEIPSSTPSSATSNGVPADGGRMRQHPYAYP